MAAASHGDVGPLTHGRHAGVRHQPGDISGQRSGWCLLIGFSAVIWRILIASGRVKPPRALPGLRFLLGAITAILVVAVAMRFQTLNGLAAGTALLVVMGALKLFESRTRR